MTMMMTIEDMATRVLWGMMMNTTKSAALEGGRFRSDCQFLAAVGNSQSLEVTADHAFGHHSSQVLEIPSVGNGWDIRSTTILRKNCSRLGRTSAVNLIRYTTSHFFDCNVCVSRIVASLRV